MKTPDSEKFACVLRAWQAHEKELLTFLLSRTDNLHAAEDLLQEVFLKSMQQGRKFCVLKNPRAWLFTVARHALIDASRLTKPITALPEHLEQEPADERHPVDELAACIVRNLPELTAEDRHIIEACDLHNQTVRSYAQTNGLTVAAAKSRLLRARKRLRECLVKNCQVRFDATGRVCCHVPRSFI
ncbi:MAG: sigma-70 family RNA polymerase sigma factor [Desulfobulbus sp.]|nr:sigma-70 family RNA polymerase sigma factor [Desulfobulbus sp.]